MNAGSRDSLLTEAVEDIKEGDEKNGDDVDWCAQCPQMEWTPGEVLSLGQDIGHERDGIRHSTKHDKRACQVKESCAASKRDGAQTSGDNSCIVLVTTKGF